jgi:hypothetical protein
MSNYQTIDIDSIADQGAQVPDGTYTFRLKEAKGSDKKVMVIAEFEVVSGEYEGFTATKFFLLVNKDQPFALGILDYKKTLVAAEKSLEKGYPFPLDSAAAAKLFTKKMGNTKVTGTVKTEKNKRDGKEYSRIIITGVAHAVQTVDEDVDFDAETFEDYTG